MLRLLKPTLLGVLLVDIPVLVGVVAAGLVRGFQDSFAAYAAWREEHPWTFVASLLLVVGFVALRRRHYRALATQTSRKPY